MSITIHDTSRPIAADEIAAWKDIPTSIAVDVDPSCQIDPNIRLMTTAATGPLLGPALTVAVSPPDFGAVVLALDHAQPDDVIVIAGGGQMETALIGEILGGHLKKIGCAGVIVDAPIRDIATVASWEDFPVYARGVNPRGPTSAATGVLNGIVNFGGRQIASGDLIIGDRDGLAALDPVQVRDRLVDAETKLATEKDWIKKLNLGHSAKEVFGL